MDTTAPTRLDRRAIDEAEAIQVNELQPIVSNTDDADDMGEYDEWLRKRRAQRDEFASRNRPAPR